MMTMEKMGSIFTIVIIIIQIRVSSTNKDMPKQGLQEIPGRGKVGG